MTLPVNTAPTYFLEIPSVKKKIKFRPFLVKEKKLLMIALQDRKSEDVILEAVRQIVLNCTYNQVEIDDLTMYDLEFIFLNLYMKSKDNKQELTFRCENEIKPGEICGHLNTVTLNLDDVFINKESVNNKIMLTDTLGVILKYPKFSDIKYSKTNNIYEKLPYYLDSIFDGEDVIDEYTEAELTEFIDTLTDEQFSKIEEFIDSEPKLHAKLKIKCSKCGHEEEVILEGLQSFLGF